MFQTQITEYACKISHIVHTARTGALNAPFFGGNRRSVLLEENLMCIWFRDLGNLNMSDFATITILRDDSGYRTEDTAVLATPYLMTGLNAY